MAWGLWLPAIALQEQVPANDGLGWDGVRFARYATQGPQALLDREINSYYVQRVGPSFLVHGIIRVLDAGFDAVTIRWTFLALNLTLLSGAILMMSDIARMLGLAMRAHWFLFLGLFVNPANGRLPVYYANIGDSVAFTLGMMMVWGWASRRTGVLVAASLMALVSWPAAFYLLLPLLVWPRSAGQPATHTGSSPDRQFSGIRFAAALPVGALLLAASWRAVGMPEVPGWTPWTTLCLVSNAWLLGLAAVAAVTRTESSLWRAVATGWSWRTVALAIGLALAGQAYVVATESGSLAFSEGTYWREVLLYVRTRPLAPPVGHVAYFGALAVVAVVVWPRALTAARRLGPGPFIALALIGLQALDTESRRLNANWPLVALCVVLAIEPWLRRNDVVTVGVASSLLFSKLWWRWSGPTMFAEAHEPGNYYNLQGPSLSGEAYLVHLVGATLLGVGVWLVVRRPPEISAPWADPVPDGSRS